MQGPAEHGMCHGCFVPGTGVELEKDSELGAEFAQAKINPKFESGSRRKVKSEGRSGQRGSDDHRRKLRRKDTLRSWWILTGRISLKQNGRHEGATGFIVEAKAHQGERLRDAQAVPKAPAECFSIARGQEKTRPGKFRCSGDERL